ncbi:unnamed protein product (macronuclear) [Paramecium tetraurelia]|uniref:ALMS motif domain-containing protein n=1 Tax=Paramecium tetraurelia TaxID=5888 RepID=A0E0E3_PARTE|nr:uncharacterized protein GSPATT00021928001 [Paramecium tetraurelia]CAK88760.1 unnamed protein product [Paramecium tetraurelia]|eukprot:XP_001456157.1 hypothetical protein (macronuclear) [Paramecium tetraurelia strain d4-2]
MSNCGTPLCLTPQKNKEVKRRNVLLNVPDEMINYTPLEQITLPKNQRIRQSFSKFLCGNIDEKEFVRFKCFPQSINQPIQQTKKIRNRHEDYTIQLKRQAAKERAKQRWKRLAEVVQQNIQLRRQSDSNYQSKILSRIELGMKIQNQLAEQSATIEDLKSYKLQTMLVLKEKKKKQNQSCFISPKHYQFELQELFKEQSDQYLYIYHKNLPNTSKLSEKDYNQLLDTYLHKKQLFDQYLEQKKQRKLVKWKPMTSTSTFYSTSMSCQSNGLKRESPLMRLQKNPLEQQQQQRQTEYFLVNQINEVSNPKMATSIVSKKHQRPQNTKDKLKGIVKHNRIKSMDYAENDDDDGLNMSNASITEALLDQLYLGSQKLQSKLKQQNVVQKRVRDILRLQEMKVNTINANYQKLNKYQQKHQ